MLATGAEPYLLLIMKSAWQVRDSNVARCSDLGVSGADLATLPTALRLASNAAEPLLLSTSAAAVTVGLAVAARARAERVSASAHRAEAVAARVK